MKIKKALLGFSLLILSVGITSCKSNVEEEIKPEYKDIEAYYEATDFNSNIYKHNYVYNDSYFLENSFNPKLAKASFALALSTQVFSKNKSNDENFKDYLGQLGFSNFYANEYLYKETKIDGIGLELASKEVKLNGENKTLVAATIRGFNYDYEWISNFIIGKTGDHDNFKKASITFIEELDSYVKKLENKDIVLWLSGYSRGGGVSNLIGAYLDNYSYYKENDIWLIDEYKPNLSFDIDLDEIFCYTFEAPKGAEVSNVKALENVTYNIHNIINESDMVPMVLPKELGFSEYGKTHNVLLDPSLDEFENIGTNIGINYDVLIDEYSLSLTKIDNVEPIQLGNVNLYPKKLDNKIYTKDYMKGLIDELSNAFQTRENYSKIVDPILKEVCGKFRDLSKEDRKKVANQLIIEFKNTNMLSFLSSSSIKKIVKNSFAIVKVTISDGTYKCIDELYSIVKKIIASEISFEENKLFKRTATFYMNQELIIINHIQAFIAEYVEIM